MSEEIYCVTAYKGFRIAPQGACQLCCKSEEDLTDRENNPAVVGKNSIEEIFYGAKATEIRTALKNGIRHPNCKKCWDEEDAGIMSKRLHDNRRAPYYWGNEEYDEFYNKDLPVVPEHVEFNFGNMCNLKCRICGPWSSSFWKKEYKDLYLPNETNANYESTFRHWSGPWTNDNPVWNDIDTHLQKFKKIDIFGGEPFLVERQWEMLRKSVANGWSKYQSLHFNTNGTQFKEEHIKLLPEFERVFLSFSIDGIEEKFEHQRHPAIWKEALQNILAFKELSIKYPNISVNVCNTVNIQNVFYIPETMKFFAEHDIVVYMNYCHWPLHYNAKNIPETIKQKIFQHYEQFNDPWIKQNLADVRGHMSSQICDIDQWNKFLDITKRTDEYRKENSRAVFPEFWNLIDENL